MKTHFGAAPYTSALPTVEDAKSGAIDDPRVPYLHGRVQELKSDNFTCRYWREQRHAARVTNLDTNEVTTYEDTTSAGLNEKLVHVQHNLLIAHEQARVEPLEPREVWVADLTYGDGSSERAESATRDDLLSTILSWKGKTTAALLPERVHRPLWTVKTANEAIAAQHWEPPIITHRTMLIGFKIGF
jgi:hypothetical protein